MTKGHDSGWLTLTLSEDFDFPHYSDHLKDDPPSNSTFGVSELLPSLTLGRKWMVVVGLLL